MFDCDRCERAEQDRRRGCPKCELTVMYRGYLDEIVKQMIRFANGFPEGWSLDALIRLHAQVAGLVESSKRRIRRKWNVRLAKLARIYLSEQAQLKAVSDFEYLQQIRAQSQTQPQGGPIQITRMAGQRLNARR